MQSYAELFSIELLHTFYNDSRCCDFTLQPTVMCESIIKGHKLILKTTGNGIKLIAPCDESNNPFISMSPDITLSFLMKLENPELKGFTALPALGNEAVYRFHNENINAVGEASLDQGEMDMYQVETADYDPVFGIIEIENNGSVPAVMHESSNYTITLSARQEIWKYYLIVKDNTHDWSVIDDENQPITFQKTDLNQNEPEDDSVADAIKSQFPGSQRFLFESDQAISYRSDGRKNLQLKKGMNTLIEHLPNPSFLSNGIKIIKFL